MRLLVGATLDRCALRSWLIAGDLPIISAETHGAFACSSLDLALQLGRFERAQRDEDQPVGLERLLDVIVGAALDRGDGRLDVAVAGDDDDRQIGIRALDDGQSTSSPSSRLPCSQMSRTTRCGRRSSIARSASSLSRASRVRCAPRPRGCRRPDRGYRPRRRRSRYQLPSVRSLGVEAFDQACSAGAWSAGAACSVAHGVRAPSSSGSVMRTRAPRVRPGAGGASSSAKVPPCCSTTLLHDGETEPGALVPLVVT